MKTVEERAQELWEETRWLTEQKDRVDVFAQYLRDQIEDCAKVADKYEQSEKEEADKFRRRKEGIAQATHVIMSVVCMRLGKEIRALAGKKEETEADGVDEAIEISEKIRVRSEGKGIER